MDRYPEWCGADCTTGDTVTGAFGEDLRCHLELCGGSLILKYEGRQPKGSFPADLNPFGFSKLVSNAFSKALQLLITPMVSSG